MIKQVGEQAANQWIQSYVGALHTDGREDGKRIKLQEGCLQRTKVSLMSIAVARYLPFPP